MYWFSFILPKITSIFSTRYQEVLYRIVPFLAAVLVCWLFQYSLPAVSGLIPRVLWGFAAAVIPLVFYYSSILYLEMPAVVLMLIACLRIQNLLVADFDTLRQDPGWYALILIGFIKETAITFLFCFVAYRITADLVKRWKVSGVHLPASDNRRSWLRWLTQEVSIAFCVLFPLFFYLFLRSTLAYVKRSFSPEFASLLSLPAYGAVAQSFIQQFGVFFLFFMAGCVLLLLRKDYLTAGFLLLLVVFIPLFHIVDGVVYAGYSRFNLFLLAPVLAGASIFIGWILSRRKLAGSLLACVVIGVNLWMSPIYSDGTKVPLWGNYLVDTSEHYYPYEDALVWLNNNAQHKHILFAGMNYEFFYKFYFGKLDWYPSYATLNRAAGKTEADNIVMAIDRARTHNYPVVVYRIAGKTIPPLPDIAPYRQVKVIQNMAHMLVIYERQ